MRLPKEAELSREQKEICYAPTVGTMLVQGPPGSGKTVVALFRAKALESQEKKAATLVYNHVLCRYTGTESTFYKWLMKWWRSTMGGSFPYMWEDGKKVFDYERAKNLVIEKTERVRRNGHWGHVVLDEAQDFSPEAHRLLFSVMNLAFTVRSEREKPSLLVLADENQILTDDNSTLSEIRREYMLTGDSIYDLRRNYRNTREIAQFAGHFFTGLPTGMPDLPNRRGDKPRLIVTPSLDDAVTRIARHAKLHEEEEIGVLVFYDRTRKKLFNKLKYRLEGTGIKVQTYTWKDKGEVAIDFDTSGTVTILCFASGKGLEFDTVFLPELQAVPLDSGRRDQIRMSLYVMTSRARKRLVLMISDPKGEASIWELLPRNRELFEFEDGGS